MVTRPSRRDILSGSAGALAGVTGGLFARPYLADGSDTEARATADSIPLAWDDTEWPFPDYDPARTRHPPARSAPDDDLERDWRIEEEPADAHTPPVVANGCVFTGTASRRETTVRAAKENTGDVAWRHRFYGEADTHPNLVAAGDGVYYRISDGRVPFGLFGAATGGRVWGISDPPLGAWTIGDGRLYYSDRSSATLRTYDARTGEPLWSTTVDDSRLVVQSFHHEFGVFATSFGTLYTLDPADGTVLWTVSVPDHTKSGPVVAEGRAFLTEWGDSMDLVAVDAASGDRQWQYPLSPNEIETSEGVFRRWYELGAATSEVVLVRERHADPTPGALHAVEATTGTRRWRTTPPDGARAFSDVTVVAGDVYVCAGGDDRTELLRIDAADGSRTASWELPSHGIAPVVTDSRVLVQTNGELLAFT